MCCGEASTKMTESPRATVTQTETPSPWNSNRPKKKGAAYYKQMKEDYRDFIQGNELLTIPEALNAVTRRTISLLTSDIKTRKFVGVS